jgi:hypothetical protein
MTSDLTPVGTRVAIDGHVGRVVRKFQPEDTGITIEDENGVRHSAHYGPRIRLLELPL